MYKYVIGAIEDERDSVFSAVLSDRTRRNRQIKTHEYLSEHKNPTLFYCEGVATVE